MVFNFIIGIGIKMKYRRLFKYIIFAGLLFPLATKASNELRILEIDENEFRKFKISVERFDIYDGTYLYSLPNKKEGKRYIQINKPREENEWFVRFHSTDSAEYRDARYENWYYVDLKKGKFLTKVNNSYIFSGTVENIQLFSPGSSILYVPPIKAIPTFSKDPYDPKDYKLIEKHLLYSTFPLYAGYDRRYASEDFIPNPPPKPKYVNKNPSYLEEGYAEIFLNKKQFHTGSNLIVGPELNGPGEESISYEKAKTLREEFSTRFEKERIYNIKTNKPIQSVDDDISIYVFDKEGHFYVGNRHPDTAKNLIFHTDLLRKKSFLSEAQSHGEDTACAGELKASFGKITFISNKSGHYLPTKEQFALTIKLLDSYQLFHKECKVEVYADVSYAIWLMRASVFGEVSAFNPHLNEKPQEISISEMLKLADQILEKQKHEKTYKLYQSYHFNAQNLKASPFSLSETLDFLKNNSLLSSPRNEVHF